MNKYILLFTIIISGCEFEYSPYEANPDSHALNNYNISLLNQKSTVIPTTFKIAVIADTNTYYDELLDVVGGIKAKNDIDFIVHCGDFTNHGLLKEYEWGEAIIQSSHIPYIVVIGNHDALANGRVIYQDMFGAYNFSFTYNGAYFIILNNNNWEFNAEVPNLGWLESELQKIPTGRMTVVLMHIPPFDSTRFSLSQRDQIQSLMQDYNVSMVLNGHRHAPAHSEISGVDYVTVGSVSNKSFLLLDISPTVIGMERIYE